MNETASTILIIDDDKQVIQQLSEWIVSFGHIPRFTLEPEYLLQLLDSTPIDLILLDVYMPGIDGIAVLEQLQAHPRYQRIPVIMLTADVDDKLLEKCFDKGAVDFLNKPPREVVLKSRIKSALTTKNYIEQLQQAIDEKVILLKEIHHRVKNNLQIISSLFILQSGGTKDEQVLKVLKESQSRIESMALIHEKLYQSESLAKINFNEYLQDLTTDIFHSYDISHGQIELHVDIGEIELDIDTAIPCGLIINELISNVIKYAFPDKPGVLNINFHLNTEKEYELLVQDNGVGIPEDLQIETANSLGLRLVRILVNQLKGKLQVKRDQGTQFIIQIPKPSHKKGSDGK